MGRIVQIVEIASALLVVLILALIITAALPWLGVTFVYKFIGRSTIF